MRVGEVTGSGRAGFEGGEPSAPIVADGHGKDAKPATQVDVTQRGVSASEPSVAELERAIVDATLAGRMAVAELLADRLRARLVVLPPVLSFTKRTR